MSETRKLGGVPSERGSVFTGEFPELHPGLLCDAPLGHGSWRAHPSHALATPRRKKSRPPPEKGMAGGEGRRHLRIVAGFTMLGEVEALIFLVTVYSQADRCVDDFQQDDTHHAGQQDGIE